jgi:hypothetical protein
MATFDPSNNQAHSSLDKTSVENTEDIETARSSSSKHMGHARIERVELTELDVSPPFSLCSLRRQVYPASNNMLTCAIEIEQENPPEDR